MRGAMMRFSKVRLALAVALGLACHSVSALGLLQAYDAALQNDPTYRGAIHEHEAGQEALAIGRASLLPTLSANYGASRNHADRTFTDARGRESSDEPRYTSQASTLSLRQPLINMEGVARYRQGQAQVNYSDAVFSARGQDLMLRLVATYTDALFAEDQLRLAVAQRDAFAEQMRVNKRMFDKGEGTRTEMLETQARYELAEAQVIEAQDNLQVMRRTLEGMVGTDVGSLATLIPGLRPMPLQPARYADWEALALANNADIAAQRFAVDAAEQEVSKNRAGHLPRLDFVASYGKNNSETLNTLNQDANVRSAGVQLTIPLYAGGQVSAVTRQAAAGLERAKADLAARTDKVLIDLRKQYSLALSSQNRIDALEKAVASAYVLIDASRKSVQSGLRINLDVLNAQQQYYTFERDLAQARYAYVLAWLRLRAAAGVLNPDELQRVAAYFGSGAT